jgi:hypothetical protein
MKRTVTGDQLGETSPLHLLTGDMGQAERLVAGCGQETAIRRSARYVVCLAGLGFWLVRGRVVLL